MFRVVIEVSPESERPGYCSFVLLSVGAQSH